MGLGFPKSTQSRVCTSGLTFVLKLFWFQDKPHSRLGRFGTHCIIQLFLGTPLIDIHEKLHSSSQNSKTRAGAGLDDINMDQSETRHIRSGF